MSEKNPSEKKKTGYIHRCTLFHVTTPNEAEQIIKSQKIKIKHNQGIRFHFPIEGVLLDHCYFCIAKKINKIKPTILVADVYIGKYITMTRNEIFKQKDKTEKLKNEGYNAILQVDCSYKTIYCLNENIVFNIKYTYGQKPNAFFKINNSRISLFKYVSAIEANIMCSKQSFQKTKGAFGNFIYLYYTMDDAYKQNKKGETFLICDANVKNIHECETNEYLGSNKEITKNYKVFCQKHLDCYYYLFADSRLIFNIRYCYGKKIQYK